MTTTGWIHSEPQLVGSARLQFYAEHLAPLHCLCFGIFGDSLGNLVWRVENGEVKNFSPKCIVVSIGQSEDLKKMTVDDFLSGLKRLTSLMKEKQPRAELFVLVSPNCRPSFYAVTGLKSHLAPTAER